MQNKLTHFSYRLAEKQKLRFYYGISENQLIRYIKISRRAIRATSTIILEKIEMRLDNLLYRIGRVQTLAAARQLVSHGHILVGYSHINIPSFSCFSRQTITVRKI